MTKNTQVELLTEMVDVEVGCATELVETGGELDMPGLAPVSKTN